MKQLVVGFFLLVVGVTSQAVTRGQFAGVQMMINMTSMNYDGTIDGSPQTLFNAMNRPEEDSIAGRGKKLQTSGKVFNFICARRGDNNYHCSIYISQSAHSRIGPGYAELDLRGEEARALFDQFHSSGSGFDFKDEDGQVRVYVTPERFYILFKSNGL